MADKTIPQLQPINAVSDDVNFGVDDGTQSYRMTVAQLKAFFLGNNSIITSMINNLAVTTAKLAAGAVTDAKTSFTPPTIQTFTSGSGTYNTPAGVKWIRVRMAGGGGGGAGAGASGRGAGGNGGDSTFGSSLLTAGLGYGSGNSDTGGGIGGTPTVNSPAIAIHALYGQDGQTGGFQQAADTGNPTPGYGGSTPFLGGGGTCNAGGNGRPGNTNTGSGGSGSHLTTTISANSFLGGGGGSGAYVEAIIVSPNSTYAYAVGGGGGGGSAGTSGGTGGAGASGVIIVEEHYQ